MNAVRAKVSIPSATMACTVLSLTTVTGFLAPKGPICSGDLLFHDDFNELNNKRWKHEITLGGGSSNNQFQSYTNNRSVTYVKDSILHIVPILLSDEKGEPFLSSGTMDVNSWLPQSPCTNAQFNGCLRTGTPTTILNPIKSARMNTADSFAFKYGKLEVRAKASAGDWLWPAIWMVPRWMEYSSWPSSGEIDILESRGNRDLTVNNVNIGTQQMASALHWGTNPTYNKYRLTTYTTNLDSGWDADFHNYQLLWTPDEIQFSIDDNIYGTCTPPDGGFWEMGSFNKTGMHNPWSDGTKMAPFDSEFFLILNIAVGGTSYFPDSSSNPYPKPWKNSDGPASFLKFWNAKNLWLPTWNVGTDDSHLQVDYVKIWAL